MIRKAAIADIEEICELRVLQQKADWQETYIDKFGLYNTTKTFLKKHLNKDLYIFLNIVDNCIASTCGVQIINYLPQCNDNGKQGYICNVYTIDEYRKKGLQEELLSKVIEFSKKNELFKLSLASDNEIVINLYKKFGFKHDSLMMSLKL